VLKKLSIFFDEKNYDEICYKLITNYHDVQIKYGLSFSYLLSATYFYFSQPKEIAVILKDENSKENILKEFYSEFIPFKIIAMKNNLAQTGIELLKNKDILNGKNTIYICQNYTCKAPVFSFEEAKNELL